MKNTLRINGSVVASAAPAASLAGEPLIHYKEAMNAILDYESDTKFSDIIREELPAIVSHWLQSPEEAPILLDESYRDRWQELLRARLQIKPTKGRKSKNAHPPFHISFEGLPFMPQADHKFTFIDLFAGIGGFRIGLTRNGGKCVFSSEWDKHAKQTYFQNYGEVPFGDITNFTKTNKADEMEPDKIPQHDILCGGFPCQPFSQAGRQLGFNDARGTLFFDILTIAKTQRPKVLFLENVKRLRGHDGGKTFQVICNSLREIGYKVYAKVVRAYDFGVPQNRERIFIVAFSEPICFKFPEENRHGIYKNVGEVLEKKVDDLYTISDRMWAGHQRRLEEHRKKGNGFGYSLFNHKDLYVNTISARYWKDGSEILIQQDRKNPRILTPRECARIQGYPEEFLPHSSRRYAYQQFGNSVAVPVIEAIGYSIVSALNEKLPCHETLDSLEPVLL
jgi:DNA (cytosine-5)-methyltransferase 1